MASYGDHVGDWPRGLAQPARRALLGAGYTTLEQLATARAADLRHLHGMGPRALELLRRTLADRGLAFADEAPGPRE